MAKADSLRRKSLSCHAAFGTSSGLGPQHLELYTGNGEGDKPAIGAQRSGAGEIPLSIDILLPG
jgi:hypothetical protein